MAGIFISYRQADATAWAIALRDDLAKIFGEEQVFLDKDTLHAGNWRDQINQALDRCAVALIVIGPRWLTILDEQNQPRIGLAEDVHHQEIALALDRKGVTVIPVLVEDAPMPRAEQLPTDLHGLCDQQAYKIGDTQARRKADLEVLVKNIQAKIAGQAGHDVPTRPLSDLCAERTIVKAGRPCARASASKLHHRGAGSCIELGEAFHVSRGSTAELGRSIPIEYCFEIKGLLKRVMRPQPLGRE